MIQATSNHPQKCSLFNAVFESNVEKYNPNEN
jgi:hypothetical protein